MKSNKKISIKELILYFTLLIFVIPISIITIGSYYIISNFFYKELISKQKSLSLIINQKINHYLDSCEKEINILSNFMLANYNKKDYEQIIQQCFNLNGNLISIFLLNNKKIFLSYPEINIEENSLIFFSILNQIKNRTNIYNFDNYPLTNLKSIIYIKEINSNDVKFIYSVINLDSIIDLFNIEIIDNPGLYFIVTDNKNNVIVNNTKTPRNLLNNINIIQNIDLNNNKNIISYNNANYLLYREVYKELNWNIIILQELSYIKKPTELIKILYIFVFIVGLIITIISYFIGVKLIFKPMSEINYDAARIAHGDYNIKFKESIIVEINQLIVNINKMLKIIFQRDALIEESEIKYRKLIEDSLDFFFKIKRDFKLSYVSPAVEKLLGYKKEEFADSFVKYLSNNIINIKAGKIIRNIFTTKESPPPFFVEAIHKNGYKIILEVLVNPVFKDNEVIEIQGAARDVTSKYKSEKEINYLKNFLMSIIESMPSALITLNKKGLITQVNSSAKKMLNLSSKEIYNKVLWEVSPRFEKYKKYFYEVLINNKSIYFREEIKQKEETKYYNISFYPLVFEEIIGMVLRIDDVTEIENTENQLRQIQKIETIGTMASGLAHDFNNILGAILGSLTLIDYKTKNKKSIHIESLKEDLEIIREATKKGTFLIKQLLSLSKKQDIKFEILDINAQIRDVINLIKPSIDKQINIIFNPANIPLWISGVPVQIEQMALNLILNAKDAIKNSGTITISIEKLFIDTRLSLKFNFPENQQYALLIIKDTGYGIPDSLKDKIFDPFFTTKEKGKGTGLGLTMVYNIVKQHKGHIEFESEEGKGTTFKIYFPLVDVNTIHINNTKNNNNNNNDKIIKGCGLIFVVDDEDYIRKTTLEILKICGYNTLEAKNGKEALDIYKENYKEINGIILDIILPDIQIIELIKELKKINKNVKILLSSGIKNEAILNEAGELGVKNFIQKPYTLEELSNALSSYF